MHSSRVRERAGHFARPTRELPWAGRGKPAAEKLSLASRSDRLAHMESDSSALLGKRAKQIRLRKKLRIVDVAERANLAMSTISKVENGQMALTYDRLLRLSRGLGVTLSGERLKPRIWT